jgi:L-ascorbate metabolism protein UlaG (beta-lactamase superfamily)
MFVSRRGVMGGWLLLGLCLAACGKKSASPIAPLAGAAGDTGNDPLVNEAAGAGGNDPRTNDGDRDSDGVPDSDDDCPTVSNPPKRRAAAQTDTDGDGIGDACECLNVSCSGLDACHAAGECDPRSGECTAPALADSDDDGLCDAMDDCPSDPTKQAEGSCGCDVPDTDSDDDGLPDCQDACPSDPLKLVAGVCGCGALDTDTDGDDLADCNDACPANAAKIAPGVCGCSGVEVDADHDGAFDCVDPCPRDPTRVAAPCGAGPQHIDVTWMTVTNIYAELGPLNVLIDGYVTRIAQSNFFGGGGGLQNTHSPSVPNVELVGQVLSALGGAGKLDLLLTGHSHFDHSFDTATWSSLTNAPIIGSRTTCFQAVAQGIPAARCTEVLGGEKLSLAPGVTLRVIRWNHSGDSTNPEQHDAVELASVPIPDPATGGLRAGVAEDFPNGGGGRAFLFTLDGVEGPYTLLFMNSGGAKDLDVPIVVDGVNYGAPLQNLKAALLDAGLSSVDLLIAPSGGGGELAKLVFPIVHPKACIPVHWDNFYAAFLARPPTFKDAAFTKYLNEQNVRLFAPVQVMDKWRLSRSGVEAVSNSLVKQALPFQ